MQKIEDFLAQDFPERPIIGSDLLDAGGIMLITGLTEVGKSYMIVQLSYDLATGQDFLGFAVKQPWRVALVQAEISHNRFQRRMRKIGVTYGNHPDGLFVMTDYGLKLDDPRQWARLDKELSKHPIDVLILDPMRPFHHGTENSDEHMEAFFGGVRRLQDKHGCATIIAHHLKKPNEFIEGSLYDIRGSGVITDRPDTILRLTKTENHVTLTFDKVRNGEMEHPLDLQLTVNMDGLFVSANTLTDALVLVPADFTAMSTVLRSIAQELEISKSSADRVLKRLVDANRVTRTKVDGKSFHIKRNS